MVDIVMATYNGDKYIGEQLDSIINQSYKDIRIIIRDDGSADDTIRIIQEYEEKYPEIVFLINDDVKCGSSCRNFMQAMKSSTAEYVMCSDQDDYWLPNKISHSLKRMIEIEQRIGKDKPVLVFGSYKPVDEKLKTIKNTAKGRQEAAYKLKFSNLLVQNYVNGCLMMINRTLADLMGDYNDAILMHDWWGALIAAGGGTIEHIDEVMMYYRQHRDNVVGSVDVKSFKYRFRKILDPKTKEASKLYLKQAKLLDIRNGRYLIKERKAELERFISLYEKNKIGRILELIKGKYLKSDFIRILGQFWHI